MFRGSRDEAVKAAMLDFDQFVITRIRAYRGDPFTRTTMEFEVEFADGTVVWQTYTEDLSSTVQFEDYCRSRSELFPLIYSAAEAKRYIQQLNRSVITDVEPGIRVFVDLRSYGATWYQQLSLPDADHNTYVVVYEYIRWHSAAHRKIIVLCPIFDEQFTVDHCFVKAYGRCVSFDASSMVLIDRDFIKRFPQVLPDKVRNK